MHTPSGYSAQFLNRANEVQKREHLLNLIEISSRNANRPLISQHIQKAAMPNRSKLHILYHIVVKM